MSEKKYVKNCEHCGDPFVASKSDARFCSAAHRAASSREKHRINPKDQGSASRSINLQRVLKSLDEIEKIHKKIHSLIDECIVS